MRADIERSLRRIKPERFVGALQRRPDTDLAFVADAPLPGPPLLLDTCVYVDALEGTLPPETETFLRIRMLFHLSVVLGELQGVISDLPPHRIESEVSAGVLLEAGILSGLVFRLGGFQLGQEVAALNDATIYLHALERGYSVLTRNIRDFDFMSQIMPSGRVLFYRAL